MKHRGCFSVLILAAFLILSGCAANGPLIKATADGDVDEVKEIVGSGADINEPGASGITPLMYAIYYRNSNVAKYFIESGANISLRDKTGKNALLYAIEADGLSKKSSGMVKLLLKKGADVNVRDSEGQTALDLALSFGRGDIFDDLKSAGGFNIWVPESGKARIFFAGENLFDRAGVSAGGQTKRLNQYSVAGVAFLDVDPGEDIISVYFNKDIPAVSKPVTVTAGQNYYFLVTQNKLNRFMPSIILSANSASNDYNILPLKEASAKQKINEILKSWGDNSETE